MRQAGRPCKRFCKKQEFIKTKFKTNQSIVRWISAVGRERKSEHMGHLIQSEGPGELNQLRAQLGAQGFGV